MDAGFRVCPIPGPSSLTAALSVAGVVDADVRFTGFAPSRGAERQRHWAALAQELGAIVVFEAPHRVDAMAKEWQGHFEGDRGVVVAREITKRFETIHRCRIDELPGWLERSGTRGEFVFVVEPKTQASADAAAEAGIDAVSQRWLTALASELPASRLAAIAARVTERPRAELYDHLLRQRGQAN
jgi:16S rRNA (cytidine1402-2'-O)-methyltransferase